MPMADTYITIPMARLVELEAAERERLLALAKRRAAHEASAAAHHAGRWQQAHEHHLTRHAAMRDLIDALEGQCLSDVPGPAFPEQNDGRHLHNNSDGTAGRA
jgi:hypothetical protein